MSGRKFGFKLSPEQLERHIAIRKGKHYNPEYEFKKGDLRLMGNKFSAGRNPWNKGIPMSVELKQKVSESCKGSHGPNQTSFTREKLLGNKNAVGCAPNRTTFKPGMVPWNKGKQMSEETKQKVREARLRQRFPRVSSIERKVTSWLSEAKISFVSQFILDRKLFDFAIESRRLLVECDGTYWHSRPEKIKNDTVKSQIANQNGWILLRLKEEDFTTSLARHKLFSAIGEL